jgi:hypothetical protein
MSTFINIDERYGEQEVVVIDDYKELNPEGEFVEVFRFAAGEWVDVLYEVGHGIVAVPAEHIESRFN